MIKKIAMVFVLFMGIAVNVPVACAQTASEAKGPDRFAIIYDQIHGVSEAIFIYKDNKTGREYLFVMNAYGSGLCKLEE